MTTFLWKNTVDKLNPETTRSVVCDNKSHIEHSLKSKYSKDAKDDKTGIEKEIECYRASYTLLPMRGSSYARSAITQ